MRDDNLGPMRHLESNQTNRAERAPGFLRASIPLRLIVAVSIALSACASGPKPASEQAAKMQVGLGENWPASSLMREHPKIVTRLNRARLFNVNASVHPSDIRIVPLSPDQGFGAQSTLSQLVDPPPGFGGGFMRPMNGLGSGGGCSGEGCALGAIIILGVAVVTGVVSGIAAEAEQDEHRRVLNRIADLMAANRERFDEIRPLSDLARGVEEARKKIMARREAYTRYDRIGFALSESPVSEKERNKWQRDLPKFQKSVGQFLGAYRLEPLARYLDPLSGEAPTDPLLALQYTYIGLLPVKGKEGSTRYRLGGYVTSALVLPTRDPGTSPLPAQIVFTTFPYLSDLFDLDEAVASGGGGLANLFSEMESSLSNDIADHYFRLLQPRIEVSEQRLPSGIPYGATGLGLSARKPVLITPIHPVPIRGTSVWIPFSTMWAKEVCSAVKMESGDTYFSWAFDDSTASPFQGRAVSYDFRLFDQDFQLVEQARDLAAPEYRLRSSPRPNENYFWTVRLRADVEGRDRVSKWASCDGGWNNSLWRSNAYEIPRLHSVRWPTRP